MTRADAPGPPPASGSSRGGARPAAGAAGRSRAEPRPAGRSGTESAAAGRSRAEPAPAGRTRAEPAPAERTRTEPAPAAASRTGALGRWGEDLAAAHLVALGMQVLDRNWRCASGELDLVVRDVDGTVVFVEVKTRGGSGFGAPAEAVGQVKARRLRVLAAAWLQANPGAAELRFDVIGIVRRRGAAPQLTHLRAAF